MHAGCLVRFPVGSLTVAALCYPIRIFFGVQKAQRKWPKTALKNDC